MVLYLVGVGGIFTSIASHTIWLGLTYVSSLPFAFVQNSRFVSLQLDLLARGCRFPDLDVGRRLRLLALGFDLLQSECRGGSVCMDRMVSFRETMKLRIGTDRRCVR